ncbi:MAG TPA: DegV family protein [Sporosarcina sp.]|nr:DegV family protein [Sporosarcina sp.]
MKIFADSACDLPKSFYEEQQVELIPLHVLMDGQEYRDVLDISALEVYDGIRAGQQPKTSQASPEYFLELWTTLAASGEDAVYIAFSSELSGTYNTAVMMRDQVKEDYPNFNLVILDSKCASLGYGLVVKEAARLRNNGASFEEVVEAATFYARHMEHLFTVDDLDYMAKGGRVSKASAFIGGLLSIKPLLHVEDGKLIPIEKHRGRKRVLKRMLQLIEERGDQIHEQHIGINHSDDEAFALELKSAIEQQFNPKSIEMHMIGPVIGAHVGPGTLSVYFLNKRKEQ